MEGNSRSHCAAAFCFVSGHDFSLAVEAQKELGFSPCAPFSWNFGSDFTVAGAKALTILTEGGTTEVVP
jgi:hypothetical protein